VPAPPDLVIRGALVVDGSGRPGYAADLAIRGDRIVAVAAAGTARGARRTLDAHGLVAAPGFVDIHSHSDYHLLLAPGADSSVRQGVTLEIGGNCGYAAAPIWGAWRSERAEEYRAALGLDCPWRTLEEYFATLQAARPVVNYGQLVGHNTLRGSATGGAARRVSADELETMRRAVQEAMRGGALGLSTGLAYPPGCYAEAAELVTLARTVREEGGFLAAHVRSEGDTLLEALGEVLAIARTAGIGLQISHLKTMHERNWGKLDAALALVEAARAEGLDVTADRYPYTAAHTGLDAVLPAWAGEGSSAERLARLRDPGRRDEFLGVLAARPASTWERIVIAEVREPRHRPYQGRTVAELARARSMPPAAFALDFLAADGGRVGAIFHAMSPANLERILARDWVMIASDAGCRAPGDGLGDGLPHPRAFGTFVRVLGPLVRDSRLFGLETAVRKMTADPCRRLGLADRGRLAPGFHADVVLFDPARVRDTATYGNPWSFPEGIDAVLVNGKIVVAGGAPTGARPGRVVRRGRVSAPPGALVPAGLPAITGG